MKRVILRRFEERDVDFIYKTKNNRSINQYVMADFKELSYEDAEKWVERCMQVNESFVFWAIAENNEFQNIIGWCGISYIDKKNSNALFHGITINNSNYQDGYACYEASLQVIKYVFETLNLNRLYTSCLASHKFSNIFIETIFSKREGILRNAFYKDGKYHNVVLYAILKEEYYEAKSLGHFESDYVFARIKRNFESIETSIDDLNSFVDAIKGLIKEGDLSYITPLTDIKSLDVWCSLFSLEMIAMIETTMGVKINIYDIADIDTIEELFNLVLLKKTQRKNIDPSWSAYEGNIM